jgi:hypothetical protein
MKRVVPQEMKQTFCELLDKLDGTGDADRANCTMVMTLALVNRLPPVERVQTMDFLNQYTDRGGLC